MQECHFACASLSARAVALIYLEFYVRSKIFVPEIQSFLLLKLVDCLVYNRTEFRKQKVTVYSVAVATTKLLLGMCDCTIGSDVGTGNFSLLLGMLQMCMDTRMYDRTCLRE